jgi:4-amino-4-deoxy-L-arabinose transferase-like glycosyltransferase
MALAKGLQDGHGFTLASEPPYFPSIRRSPGYPIFLASMGLVGASSETVVWIQVLMDSIVAVLVVWIARGLAPGALAPGAGLMYAVHPGALWASSSVLSETLFTFLLCTSVFTMLLSEAGRRGRSLAAGALMGCAALTRPIAAFYAVGFWLIARRRFPRMRGHLLAFVLSSMAVIVPWSIRTSVLAGRPTLLQACSACTLYIASRTDWNQVDESELWPRFYSVTDPCGRMLVAANPAPRELGRGDERCLREALSRIIGQPLAFVRSRLTSFPRLFITSFDFASRANISFGDPELWGHPKALLKIVLLVCFSLAPAVMAVIGARHLLSSPAGVLILTILGITLLFHVPQFVEYRFWLPVVPMLTVCMFCGLRGERRG